MPATHLEALARDGCFILPRLVPPHLIDAARVETESIPAKGRRRGGVRHASARFESCRAIAGCSEMRSLMRELLGDAPVVTRSILFDKGPGANWEVPWHRDMTIAVRERIESALLDDLGFGPWSVKDGAHHVRAPETVLAKMVTIRIHLDDCTAATGALRVIPGTHRDPAAAEGSEVVLCESPPGGALVMRPLLAHMSEKCKDGARRRVLHLECAGEHLPGGLQWIE